MGNRTSRTVPTNSTTPASNTMPRIDQQPSQEGAQDAPEVPPRSSSLPLARARNRFPELFGLIDQRHAYRANRRNVAVSVEQRSSNPSLPSLTARRSQQRQQNHYVRLPLSCAHAQAAQRPVAPLRLPNPPTVPRRRLARRRNRLSPLSNHLPEESSNAAATTATAPAGATAATIPSDAIAATSMEGASEQQPNMGLRTITEWRAARLVRAPSQDSQSGEHSAADKTSSSAYSSAPVAEPRQPPSRKPPSGQPWELHHDGGGDAVETPPPPLPPRLNPRTPAPLPLQPQRKERPVAPPRRSLLRSRVQPGVIQCPSDGEASATVTALGNTAAAGSSRTISLTPADAYHPERSRQPPMPAPQKARQRIELHPPLPTQGNDHDKATMGESAGKAPSSPYKFCRKAYSKADSCIARWSPHLAATVPPPPSEPPPPPPPPPHYALVAAASPVRVEVAAQSPMALDRNCDKTAIDGRGTIAVAVPPQQPPLLPPPSRTPPPPPRHSFSVAAETDPVHFAVPTYAVRQPTAQLRSRDQEKARKPAAAADTAFYLPNEPYRLQKERQQRQSQPTQRGRHGEAQKRRLDATMSRASPRMMDETLDQERHFAIQRIATQRVSARRSSSYSFVRSPNSAAGSDSVRCGDDATADAATSPQPFTVFGFDDSAVMKEEQLRELELRRAQQDLYNDELWHRTREAAAAAASSPGSTFLCDAFAFGEASAVAAGRQSITSSTASTTTNQWRAAHPATEGDDGCSRGIRAALSGLPLSARLQPEARYYGSNPLVSK